MKVDLIFLLPSSLPPHLPPHPLARLIIPHGKCGKITHASLSPSSTYKHPFHGRREGGGKTLLLLPLPTLPSNVITSFFLSLSLFLFGIFGKCNGVEKWRGRIMKCNELLFSITNGFCPTTNGGMQNGSSVGMCTRCTHVFARLAPICCAQSVLINKISASELSRKFITSAVSVGCASDDMSTAALVKGKPFDYFFFSHVRGMCAHVPS